MTIKASGRNLQPLVYERISILEGLDVIERDDLYESWFANTQAEFPPNPMLSPALQEKGGATARVFVGEDAEVIAHRT